MTRQQELIAARLNEMGLNMTTTINNKAVTRWSTLTWEVGTYGKKIQCVEAAVDAIME